MSQSFETLISDARTFYAALAQNNNREWFTENKPMYEAGLKKPAKALLDEIAPRLGGMLDQSVTTKLFRVNRDVRFSKDKTPYTLHLHMIWSPQSNGTQPAYFFGIVQTRIDAAVNAGATLSKPELKRVPSPFEKDHPRGELLRRKSLVLWSDFESEVNKSGDLVAAIMDGFELLDPVMEELRAFL